jgi:hypothetical protein
VVRCFVKQRPLVSLMDATMLLFEHLPFVLMGFNLLFSVFVFAFTARPHKLLGFVALFCGLRDKWSSGKLETQEEKLLIKTSGRISFLLLLLLFLSSFITGGVIAHVRLYQHSEMILNNGK